MSLKTDYALSTALTAAYDAGVAYVGTGIAPGAAYATLSAGLAAAAAQGKETFTVTVSVTHAPSTLRLQGKYWNAFKTGVLSALAAEGIYNYEITLALNTEDATDTQIDFDFAF